MRRLLINEARCKGCGFCVLACPRKAVQQSSRLNKQGAKVIDVDDSLCVKCGICYTVCPDCVFSIIDDEEGCE